MYFLKIFILRFMFMERLVFIRCKCDDDDPSTMKKSWLVPVCSVVYSVIVEKNLKRFENKP